MRSWNYATVFTKVDPVQNVCITITEKYISVNSQLEPDCKRWKIVRIKITEERRSYSRKKLTSHVTDAFWHLCSWRLMKIMWQKEKLLNINNFSFCHILFDSWILIYWDSSGFWQYLFKINICYMWERSYRNCVIRSQLTFLTLSVQNS